MSDLKAQERTQLNYTRTKRDRKSLKGALRSAFHYSWVLFSQNSLWEPLPSSDIWGIETWEMGLDTLSIWSLRDWPHTLPAELVSYPRVWSLSSSTCSGVFFKLLSIFYLPQKWKRTNKLLPLWGMQLTFRKLLSLNVEELRERERDMIFTEYKACAKQNTRSFNFILMATLSAKYYYCQRRSWDLKVKLRNMSKPLPTPHHVKK